MFSAKGDMREGPSGNLSQELITMTLFCTTLNKFELKAKNLMQGMTLQKGLGAGSTFPSSFSFLPFYGPRRRGSFGFGPRSKKGGRAEIQCDPSERVRAMMESGERKTGRTHPRWKLCHKK